MWALRRWAEVAMVLLHRRALIPAVGLKAARVRAKLRLRLRPARWVGETISILSILRRTGVVIPLLRSGGAAVVAFVHLRARAGTKGVVIFRPAIGRLLFSAGLLADAIVVLFRALLAHAGIRGTLVMRAMALLLAGLLAGVAARSGVASIALCVAVAIGLKTFAARAVVAWASVAVVVWFAFEVLVHLRSTVTVLVTVAFGAEIGSAAVTVAFRTWSIAARAGVGSARSLLIALAFAGFTALGAARLASTGTAEFIGPDLTVAVAIELPEQVGGAIHLFVINDAVAIRIERVEQPGHRALFAFATFGARCAFA